MKPRQPTFCHQADVDTNSFRNTKQRHTVDQTGRPVNQAPVSVVMNSCKNTKQRQNARPNRPPASSSARTVQVSTVVKHCLLSVVRLTCLGRPPRRGRPSSRRVFGSVGACRPQRDYLQETLISATGPILRRLTDSRHVSKVARSN